MKKIKVVFLMIAVLILVGCGTSHNYSSNNLNKDFYTPKIIYFKLNSLSQGYINFTGMVGTVLGGTVQPNVKETFKKSLEELSAETKIRLVYIENDNEIKDKDAIIMDTKISEINWHFGLSVATLKTVVIYREMSNSKEIKTIGIRKGGGGDEMNNLKKSLKDATFNFLKEFEK